MNMIIIMDILYYSNHCKHSAKIIQFLAKNGITNKINCICVDKRVVDPSTGQYNIITETGKRVTLPPNVSAVPSLLLVSKGFQVIQGDAIINHYEPEVRTANNIATGFNGEPSAFELGGGNVSSDKYTYFTNGTSPSHNYVNAEHHMSPINAMPDNYRPNKISEGSVNVGTLEQMRNNDVGLPPVAGGMFGNMPGPPQSVQNNMNAPRQMQYGNGMGGGGGSGYRPGSNVYAQSMPSSSGYQYNPSI